MTWQLSQQHCFISHFAKVVFVLCVWNTQLISLSGKVVIAITRRSTPFKLFVYSRTHTCKRIVLLTGHRVLQQLCFYKEGFIGHAGYWQGKYSVSRRETKFLLFSSHYFFFWLPGSIVWLDNSLLSTKRHWILSQCFAMVSIRSGCHSSLGHRGFVESISRYHFVKDGLLFVDVRPIPKRECSFRCITTHIYVYDLRWNDPCSNVFFNLIENGRILPIAALLVCR